MKLPDYHSEREWIDDLLEAYVDGDLSEPDVLRFEQALCSDPALKAEVALAVRIKQGLTGLQTPACPPALATSILGHVRAEAHRSTFQQAKTWYVGWLERVWRPALAFSTLVILVFTSTIWKAPDPEVDRATAEVKWTLAYLNEIGRKTGMTVRDDVLEDHVVRPVQHAVGVLSEHSTE